MRWALVVFQAALSALNFAWYAMHTGPARWVNLAAAIIIAGFFVAQIRLAIRGGRAEREHRAWMRARGLEQ